MLRHLSSIEMFSHQVHPYGAVLFCVKGSPASAGDAASFIQMGQLVVAKPDRRGEGGAAGEAAVVFGNGVQTHQASHRAARDKGVIPVGNGGEMLIHEGLELLDIPVHRDVSLALEMAPQSGDIAGEGGIFMQTAIVGIVITFHSGNNQFCPRTIHKLFHAPAFSVSGI